MGIFFIVMCTDSRLRSNHLVGCTFMLYVGMFEQKRNSFYEFNEIKMHENQIKDVGC